MKQVGPMEHSLYWRERVWYNAAQFQCDYGHCIRNILTQRGWLPLGAKLYLRRRF